MQNDRAITRGELHRLVWTKPMRELVERFGVSDYVLRKICTASDIPTPPVGYWHRRTQPKRRPRLPHARTRATELVVLPTSWKSVVLEPVPQLEPVVLSPFQDPPLHPVVEAIRATVVPVPGSSEVIAPGRLIEVDLSPALLDRGLAAADVLLRTFLERGHTVEEGQTESWLKIFDQLCRIRLIEITSVRAPERSQTLYPQSQLPPHVRRDLNKRRWNRGPTGQLSLLVRFQHGVTIPREGSPRGSVRRASAGPYRDIKGKSIEDQLGHTVATAEEIAARHRQRRAHVAELLRREEEEARQRELLSRMARAAAALDAKLSRQLIELAQRFDQIRQLKALLEHLESVADPTRLPRVSQMAEDARTVIKRLEGEFAAEALETRLGPPPLPGIEEF